MSTIRDSDQRCESRSPIYKFDESPRRCRRETGHKDKHWAKTSDGRNVDTLYDYEVFWEDASPDPKEGAA